MDARSANRSTVLSGGRALRRLLLDSPEVTAITKRIFPVVSSVEEKNPYMVYRRIELDRDPVKKNMSADTAFFSLWIFADTYEESLDLAEAAYSCLDGFRGEAEGVYIGRLWLEDASEDAVSEDGTMVQQLVFGISD